MNAAALDDDEMEMGVPQAEEELLTKTASQDPSQPFKPVPEGMDFTQDEQTPVEMDAQPIGAGYDAMDNTLALADRPPDAEVAMQMRPGQLAQPQVRLDPGAVSDATIKQRMDAQDGGGFDWSRAFFSAGGGNLSAFDAERARRSNAPVAAMQDEQNRVQGAQNFQLGQEKLNDYSRQKQAARDAIDPGSNVSLAAQQEFITLMNGRAQQLAKKPMLAAEFAEYAKRAPSMNAVQIEKAMKSPRMNEVLKMLDSEGRLAQAGAMIGIRREALRGSQEDRDMRRDERTDIREERRDEKERVRGEKLPSDTQTTEHVDSTETTKALDRAMELLPKVTYIGGGAKAANAILGALPDSMDVRTDDDREFANLMQTIAAPERHRLFGSALSKGEDIVSQELLPSLGKNKATAAQVLKKMKANLDARIRKQRLLYPGLNKIAEEAPAESPAEEKYPEGTRGTHKGKPVIRRGGKWEYE